MENMYISLYYKIKCILGFHNWLYDNPNHNKGRVCLSCGKMQEYTLVDFGTRKLWL